MKKVAKISRDNHHLLYQRRHWNTGYAKALRNSFIRPIPVVYHRELHSILRDIPAPRGELLSVAWDKYQKNKAEIDKYGVARTAAWLYVNIPDPKFRKAMQVQIDFFATKNLP